MTPPIRVFGSVGLPAQARIAISPSCPANAAIGWPGAVSAFAITSIRPGTSGRPSRLYDTPFGSLDWPRPPMYRIIEIGRTES